MDVKTNFSDDNNRRQLCKQFVEKEKQGQTTVPCNLGNRNMEQLLKEGRTKKSPATLKEDWHQSNQEDPSSHNTANNNKTQRASEK